MHQTTQRRTCRFVFLIGCILPTLAVAAWATMERMPGAARGRLTAVEHLLGMRVAADHLATPTPGTFRARGVTLANVETNAVVLSAESATFRQDAATMLVDLAGVRLAAGELNLVGDVVTRMLAVDWPSHVTIRMADVDWLGEAPEAARALLGDDALTLTLRSHEGDTAVVGREVTLHLGGAADGPIFTASRNRQISPPATRILVNTAGRRVPAAWISQLGGLVVACDGATFTGEATITHTAGGATSGELVGTLSGAALAEITQLPIEATASIHQLELRWEGGRMTRAQGALIAGGGSMAGRIAHMIQPLLYDRSIPQRGAQVGIDEVLPFGQLAVTFLCDEESFTCLGACPATGAQRAPCMLDTQGNILFGPPAYRAPLSGVGAVLANCGSQRAAEVATRLPRATHR
jgi:hypothetical protein